MAGITRSQAEGKGLMDLLAGQTAPPAIRTARVEELERVLRLTREADVAGCWAAWAQLYYGERVHRVAVPPFQTMEHGWACYDKDGQRLVLTMEAGQAASEASKGLPTLGYTYIFDVAAVPDPPVLWVITLGSLFEGLGA